QELLGPAETLVLRSAALRSALPADVPARFIEAATNVELRSRQLRDLVERLVRTAREDGHDELDEGEEKTLRHHVRGHAAYVIGICQLWQKQAAKFSLERFVPDLDALREAAEQIVTLLDKLVSLRRAAATPTPSEGEGMAELLRYMEELPASKER